MFGKTSHSCQFSIPCQLLPRQLLNSSITQWLTSWFKKNNKNIPLMKCVPTVVTFFKTNASCNTSCQQCCCSFQSQLNYICFPIMCCIKVRTVMACQQTIKSTDGTDVGKRFASDTWSIQSQYKSLWLSRLIHAKPVILLTLVQTTTTHT